MSGIECFILPMADEQDLSCTLDSFSRSLSFDGVTVMPQCSFRATSTLKSVAHAVKSEYLLLYTAANVLEMGTMALDRILSVAEDTGAEMLYADYYDTKPAEMSGIAEKKKHPLIDCQKGALRDDFDFGPVLVFKASAFRRAVREMSVEREFGALYDLRLRMKKIVHIKEFLYAKEETDRRKSGEKQFDYVDPKNRKVQIEMEQICTEYLKSAGAYLEPVSEDELPVSEDELPVDEGTDCVEGYPVAASVIIPVLNRVRTVGDAVRSALSQKCMFPFNVIVVDNHSTDGTSELLEKIAEEYNDGYFSSETWYYRPELVHIVPEKNDLGIGGCWNLAVFHPLCGRYAVQLDSDDLYSGDDVLEKIVDAFDSQECAMVVGTYEMTDFNLNPIPPGVIDHKEWTPENGHNNALRINGLGAPRAFDTDVLRSIGGFPNTSYGEDYAVGLRISREYRIGRIYDVLYKCRRWDGNSDAALSIEKLNANNLYKDWIRTCELEARQNIVRNR